LNGVLVEQRWTLRWKESECVVHAAICVKDGVTNEVIKRKKTIVHSALLQNNGIKHYVNTCKRNIVYIIDIYYVDIQYA